MSYDSWNADDSLRKIWLPKWAQRIFMAILRWRGYKVSGVPGRWTAIR